MGISLDNPGLPIPGNSSQVPLSADGQGGTTHVSTSGSGGLNPITDTVNPNTTAGITASANETANSIANQLRAFVPPPKSGAALQPSGGNPCLGGLSNLATFENMEKLVKALQANAAAQGILSVQMMKGGFAAAEAQGLTAQDQLNKQAQALLVDAATSFVGAVTSAVQAGVGIKGLRDALVQQKGTIDAKTKELGLAAKEKSTATLNKNTALGSGEQPATPDQVAASKAAAAKEFKASQKIAAIESEIANAPIAAGQVASGKIQVATGIGEAVKGISQGIGDIAKSELKKQEGVDEYLKTIFASLAQSYAQALENAQKNMDADQQLIAQLEQQIRDWQGVSARIGTNA